MTQKKILLVDDSNTVLMMQRMLLNRAYELVTARDGAEAVDKAAAEKPDLILLDIVMPGMDGFEALRRIRAGDATRDIPVIMVSTRGEEHNVEAGFELGCNDYVTKPINSLELLAKIRSFLGE